MKVRILALFLMVLFSAAVTAHSGGTDANGCHKNHKTGIYHCH